MADIRNIRRNGNNKPKDIYRVIDGKLKRVKKAYRVMNGELKLVWSIGDLPTLIGLKLRYGRGFSTVTIPILETVSHTGKIDWGDGKQEDYNSAESITHEYTDGATAHDVVIQADIVSIVDNAFKDETKLITVDMTDTGIETLGTYAFSGCTYLTTVTLSKYLTSLPNYCFTSSTQLNDVNFEGCDNLHTIGYACFSRCTYLSNLNGLSSLPALKELSGYAFYYCQNISLTLPNSIETIGNYCFRYSKSSLSNIGSLPNLKYIGDYAFYNLRYIDPSFNANVDYVGDNAYWYNRKVIPNNVVIKELRSNAFEYCTLSETFYVKVTDYLGVYTFRYCKGVKHLTTEGMGGDFTECTSLLTVTVGADSTYTPTLDNCVNVTSVTINSNKIISLMSMSGCTKISSFTIPTTIQSLGEYVFYNWTVNQTIYFNDTREQLQKKLGGTTRYFRRCYSLIVCTDQSFYYN